MGVKIARAVIVRLIGHRLDRRPGLAEPRCDLRDRADLHIDERRTERRKVGGGVGASDEAVSARDPRMRQVEPRIGHHGEMRLSGFADRPRSEEHTSELQSLMRNSYAVFCLKNKK